MIKNQNFCGGKEKENYEAKSMKESKKQTPKHL